MCGSGVIWGSDQEELGSKKPFATVRDTAGTSLPGAVTYRPGLSVPANSRQLGAFQRAPRWDRSWGMAHGGAAGQTPRWEVTPAPRG